MFIPTFEHSRVSEVRLMAARDDHRPAASRTDVGKRQEEIHLRTAELVVDETVLVAYDAILVPGMDRE